jgi:hypothetical protein
MGLEVTRDDQEEIDITRCRIVGIEDSNYPEIWGLVTGLWMKTRWHSSPDPRRRRIPKAGVYRHMCLISLITLSASSMCFVG